jgi:16S rRNA (guanine527-N7)-methyltransferase
VAPAAAAVAFRARPDGLELAQRFAEILATTGIDHGLIGPREADRLWDRHLLNCAVVAELIPADTRVLDIGSGAGLPGIVLACARADLQVTLVEPLERRVRFLHETMDELGLAEQVRVIRGRAEEPAVRRQVDPAPYVTARAVAPLDRLVRWCLPLLTTEGQLLALKGRTAQTEIDQHRGTLQALGAHGIALRTCGSNVLEEPVRVVAVRRQPYEGTAP